MEFYFGLAHGSYTTKQFRGQVICTITFHQGNIPSDKWVKLPSAVESLAFIDSDVTENFKAVEKSTYNVRLKMLGYDEDIAGEINDTITTWLHNLYIVFMEHTSG